MGRILCGTAQQRVGRSADGHSTSMHTHMHTHTHTHTHMHTRTPTHTHTHTCTICIHTLYLNISGHGNLFGTNRTKKWARNWKSEERGYIITYTGGWFYAGLHNKQWGVVLISGYFEQVPPVLWFNYVFISVFTHTHIYVYAFWLSCHSIYHYKFLQCEILSKFKSTLQIPRGGPILKSMQIPKKTSNTASHLILTKAMSHWIDMSSNHHKNIISHLMITNTTSRNRWKTRKPRKHAFYYNVCAWKKECEIFSKNVSFFKKCELFLRTHTNTRTHAHTHTHTHTQKLTWFSRSLSRSF